MRLVILGAGGYGQTVADVASQLNRYDEIVFLDDNAVSAVGKCQDYQQYIDSETEIYPAFGNNESRLDWICRLLEEGAAVSTLIHSTAYVSPKAIVECGNVILPNATVNKTFYCKSKCNFYNVCTIT